MMDIKIHKGRAFAALDELAVTFGNEERVTEAMVEAAEPIAEAARSNIPRDTGRTGDQIRVWVQKAAIGFARVLVGIPGPDVLGKESRAFIGFWAEFGIPSRGIPGTAWLRKAADAHGGAPFAQRLAGILSRGRKAA